MKSFLFSLVIVVMSGWVPAGTAQTAEISITAANPIAMADDTELLRDYALAVCIARVFDDDTVSADSGRAAAGYIDYGTLGMEVYHYMVGMVDAWLKHHEYRDEDEPNDASGIIRCAEFHHSAELRAAIERYTAERTAATTRVRKVMLAHCLGQSFDLQTVQDDVARAKRGFDPVFARDEQSEQDPDPAHTALLTLADAWLEKPYVGKHGGSFHIMRCIDFYNSPALRKTAWQYVDSRSHRDWQERERQAHD